MIVFCLVLFYVIQTPTQLCSSDIHSLKQNQ